MNMYIRCGTSFEDLNPKDVVVVKEKAKNTQGFTPVTVKDVDNKGTFFSGYAWDGKYHEYTKDKIVYFASDMKDALKWVSKKIGVPLKEIESCWRIEGSKLSKTKRYVKSNKEIAYLVTYGVDEGGPEDGIVMTQGEDIMYAKSAQEACAKWAREYASEIDGYSGCTARRATPEEVNEYEEYQRVYSEHEIIEADSITPEEYVNRLKDRKRSKEQILEEIKKEVDPSQDPSDQLQVYFNKLVPSSGKAKTLAGEIVRAMMRILYRDYNDGDLWYTGYGKETCGTSVMFLVDTVPGLERDFGDMAARAPEDSEYTEDIEDITAKVIVYLNENPELFTKKSTVDSREGYDWENLDTYFTLPTYDFDPDTSFEESYYDVDDDDIDEFIRNIVEYDLRSGSINRWARDAWTIEELDKDDYETLENMWERWFRDFLQEHEREEEYDEDEEYDEEEE